MYRLMYAPAHSSNYIIALTGSLPNCLRQIRTLPAGSKFYIRHEDGEMITPILTCT